MSGSPYRIDTTAFADTVKKYNTLEPFNFPNINFPIMSSGNAKPDLTIYMSIYAAHLYDSVILYAKVKFRIFIKCSSKLKQSRGSQF